MLSIWHSEADKQKKWASLQIAPQRPEPRDLRKKNAEVAEGAENGGRRQTIILRIFYLLFLKINFSPNSAIIPQRPQRTLPLKSPIQD
jgi:hypothetical protein